MVVRGEATHEVMPELARISVTVAARDKDRAAVLARLTERAAVLRGLLDGFGDVIERRETGGVHVRPELKRSRERVSAYHGRFSTTVTVGDFTALGDVILRVADLEQASVSGPWWELRPNSPVVGAARRAAIGDAVSRAREYAAAVGARLDRLVEIADEGGGPGGTVRMAAYDAGGMEAGQLELELDPQMQTVYAAVRVRFLITEPANLGDERADDDGFGETFTV